MADRILVVDDEPQMTLAMGRVLRRHGYTVDETGDATRALAMLARRDYSLVISDLRMPCIDGREFLRRIRAMGVHVPLIFVTAFASVESAVACVREGAVNYLQKPFSPEALVQAVDEILQKAGAEGIEVDDLDFVAVDPSTVRVVELAARAARTDAGVLLEAESGAGKEIFAWFIHRRSHRGDGPFVAVNCAALPRDLLEAELFGHSKGAFTGAIRERKGHFQAADGGTLFLDEVGEMSPDLQSRLLRVIQDGLVHPVGSESPHPVDVRIITATNRSLRKEVAEGRFREDLFYRLNVLPIRIPPLRQRPADIEPLAVRFALHHAGRGARLTDRALECLHSHDWPGNIRELENVIQRAAIVCDDGAIDVHHLDLDPAPRAEGSPSSSAVSLEEAEWEAIRQALQASSGNRSRAAATLGISPRTLRHKLKRYRDCGIPVVESAR